MRSFILCGQLLLSIVLSLCSFPSYSQDSSAAQKKLAASYFQGLRENFAKSKGFSGTWVSNTERQALLKTYSEEKPHEFIRGARTWLDKCPVDARIHLMLASLLMQTGDYQGGIHHRSMFYGLLSSIITSGDGKTPKTAFRVISSDEEHALLSFIGAKLKTQTLQAPNDVLEVEIGGKPAVMYFDVSIGLMALQRLLDGVKK